MTALGNDKWWSAGGGARARLHRVARRVGGFIGDRRGNVAMIFGLTFIPIMIACGSGVDLARAFLVQQRLGQALDAAALAVGTSLEKTDDQLETLAQSYFDANYPENELGVPGTLAMSVQGNVISLSATATVETAIMSIVGHNEMSVAASTEVTRKLTGLEVVLVLDNTGSMLSNGKIDALKTAANDLVTILFGDQETPDYLKIGLVPFSAAVNVGTEYADSGWIDTTGISSVNGLNFDSKHAMEVFAMLANKDWNGCVESRPSPLDVQDTPPDPSIGDTLWVPYFAPDEPSVPWYQGYYSNDYLDDDVDGDDNPTLQERQENTSKYDGAWVWGAGPHSNCQTRPLTPLTNDKSVITEAIDDMVAVGNTNIAVGMAWGWRVISPTEPFTEGVAYDDTKFRKAIILLTDGENVTGATNYNHNKSSYGTYGYVKDGRLGTTSPSDADDKLNERTSDVCTNIKNADAERPIVVYAITFQLENEGIKDLMRNCASDPEKYFDSPSNEELKANFKVIAGELSELRISK